MRGRTSAVGLGATAATAALVLLLLLNARLAADRSLVGERMRRWLTVLEGYRLLTNKDDEAGGERRRRLWGMGPFSDPATVKRRPDGGGAERRRERERERERERVGNAPPLPPVPRPNILYLLLDQWRFDWDGWHPQTPTGELPLNLPFLREMGENGTRFVQAYVPSPFCSPSRACMAAGREYDETGVMTNDGHDFSHRIKTVYKLLRDNGKYHVMSAGKDDLYSNDKKKFQPIDLGFSDMIRTNGKIMTAYRAPKAMPTWFDEPYRKFLRWHEVATEDGRTIHAKTAYKACLEGLGPEGGCDSTSFTEEIYPDDFVRDRAIDIFDRRPKGKPWLLQVNFPGPHPPIVSTSAMARSVMGRKWPPPLNRPDFENYPCPQTAGLTRFEQEVILASGEQTPVQPQTGGRCNYAAEIEHLDALMRSIVDHVRMSGELDRTIVVVSGDHGENLGDNGFEGKGLPWQASVSVPLLIAGPGVARGHIHGGPVATLDLGGTFLDLAGVSRLAKGMTTMSLRRYFGWAFDDDTPNPRQHVSSGWDNWRLVVKWLPTPTPGEDGGADDMTSFKLICCRGRECPGSPPTALPYKPGGRHQLMLYDTLRDPYDQVPLEHERPDVVRQLVPLLPKGWCR